MNNKEIRFRQFIYGQIIKSTGEYAKSEKGFNTAIFETKKSEKGQWHYWGVFNDKFASPISYKIESQQFTGLFDKNGKEIYEGDIVKSEGIDKTFIENVPDILRLGHLVGEHIFVPETMEIIGNIYENPELL